MMGITSQKMRFNTYTNGVDGKGVSIKGAAYCRDTISAESIGKTYIIYSDDTFTTQVTNPENDAAYIVQGYLFVYTGKDNKFMCAGLIQGPKGPKGEDGKSVSMDTIYLKHSVDNPSGIMRPSGDNPEGWSKDVPSFDENKRFIFMSQRIIDGDKKGEWSTPKLYIYYSEDGTRVSDTLVNMTNTFNELTRNGEVKGIQQAGNELYLNADYINTGVLKVGKTVTDENGNEKTAYALEAYLDGENKGEVRLAGWSVDQSMLLSPERNVALISDDSVTIDGKAVRFWASNSIVNAKGWKILYTYLDDGDEDGERVYELTLSINNDQETTIEVTAEYQKEKSYTIFSTTRPVISAVQRYSANPNVSNISGDYWTGGGDSYQQQELRITIEEAPTIIDQGTYICSDGSLYATNARIQGEIEAESGKFGVLQILAVPEEVINPYNGLTYQYSLKYPTKWYHSSSGDEFKGQTCFGEGGVYCQALGSFQPGSGTYLTTDGVSNFIQREGFSDWNLAEISNGSICVSSGTMDDDNNITSYFGARLESSGLYFSQSPWISIAYNYGIVRDGNDLVLKYGSQKKVNVSALGALSTYASNWAFTGKKIKYGKVDPVDNRNVSGNKISISTDLTEVEHFQMTLIRNSSWNNTCEAPSVLSIDKGEVTIRLDDADYGFYWFAIGT